MTHFRDARPGRFYLHSDRIERPAPQSSETPAFLRFAAKHGVAVDLWKEQGATADDLVSAAGLDWPVIRREMTVLAGRGMSQDSKVQHHYALVRPDTEQIMSVVTSAYSPAENRWVAQAVENYARRITGDRSMLAAVGFGRTGERTLFAARLTGDHHKVLCLLAYNTHGAAGAVRFEIVEVDRARQITCVLGSQHASRTFIHTGDLQERLAMAHRVRETFVEQYLEETVPLWDRLEGAPWTRNHTNALIETLWANKPGESTGDGNKGHVDFNVDRHPRRHLPGLMEGISVAAAAYRAICDWIDNRSEACERGDFTKDRDERLALGAGSKYKRDAWSWIVNNT